MDDDDYKDLLEPQHFKRNETKVVTISRQFRKKKLTREQLERASRSDNPRHGFEIDAKAEALLDRIDFKAQKRWPNGRVHLVQVGTRMGERPRDCPITYEAFVRQRLQRKQYELCTPTDPLLVRMYYTQPQARAYSEELVEPQRTVSWAHIVCAMEPINIDGTRYVFALAHRRALKPDPEVGLLLEEYNDLSDAEREVMWVHDPDAKVGQRVLTVYDIDSEEYLAPERVIMFRYLQ